MLWDPAYKGKVTIRDDGLEAVQFGALATGQNINDIKDLGAIKTKLKELLPQINTYWSAENDWNQFMSSGDIKIGTYWSGAAARARNQFKLPVTFVIPKEGAIGWLDSLAIPTGSKNVEGAKAFINYMIDPILLYPMGDNRGGACFGQQQGDRRPAGYLLQQGGARQRRNGGAGAVHGAGAG